MVLGDLWRQHDSITREMFGAMLDGSARVDTLRRHRAAVDQILRAYFRHVTEGI